MDHSIFFKFNSLGYIILVVYIDDIVIIGNDESGIDNLKLFLSKNFQIKDLGNLCYFLGI